jgi:hypothetical protein
MSYSMCHERSGHRQEAVQRQRVALQGLTGIKVIEIASGQPGNFAAPPTPKMQNPGLHNSMGAQVPEQNNSIPAEYIKPSVQYSATNGHSEAHLPDAGGPLKSLTPPVHLASFSASPEVSHAVDVRSFGDATPTGMSMATLPGPVIRQSSMGYGSDGILAQAGNLLGYNESPQREGSGCFPYNGSFPQAIIDVSQLPPQMHPLPIAAHTVYPRDACSSSHLLPSNVDNLLEFGGGAQQSLLHLLNASSRQFCTSTGRLGLTLQATQALLDYDFGQFVRRVRSATTRRVSQADAMLDYVNLDIHPASNGYEEAVDVALRCKRLELAAQAIRLQERQDRSSQDARSRPGCINNLGLSSRSLQPSPRHSKFSDWLVSRPDCPKSEPEPLDWPPIKDIMQFMTESVSPHGISMFSGGRVDLFSLRDQSNVDSQSTTSRTDVLQIRQSTAQLESTSCNGTQRRQTSGVKKVARLSASLEQTALNVESLERGRKIDAGQHPYRKLKIATGNAKSIEDSLLMPPPQTLPRQSTRVAHEAKLGQRPCTLPQTSMHPTSILYQDPDAYDHEALVEALRFDRDIPDYPIPKLPELHRNECPSKIDYGHLTAYGSAEAIASYPPTFQASLQRTMQNIAMYEFRRTQSHALVFVYGSLMISCLNHDIFNGRVSPFTIDEVSQCMVAASVTGFRRYRVHGSHEPVALGTGKEKDVIHGMLIFNLSDEDCRNLDRYTGRGYVRSRVRFCVKLKTGHTNGYARIYCAPDSKFLDCSSRGEIMVDEPWTVEDFWENSPSCMEWRAQSRRNHGSNSGVQLQQNVQDLSYHGYIGQDQPSARLEQGSTDQSLVLPQQDVTSQMLNSLEPSASSWGGFPQISPTQTMSNVEQGGSLQNWENFDQNGNDQTMSNVEQVGSVQHWEGSGQNGNDQTMSNVEQVGSVQNWEGSGQNGNDQTFSSLANAGWEPFPQMDLDPSSLDAYDFGTGSAH